MSNWSSKCRWEKRKSRSVVPCHDSSKFSRDVDSYQIWFQNRRQTSRRKSRPLLPHEIAQYQSSRSTGDLSFSSSEMEASSSQDDDPLALGPAHSYSDPKPEDEIQRVLESELDTTATVKYSSSLVSELQAPATGRNGAIFDSASNLGAPKTGPQQSSTFVPLNDSQHTADHPSARHLHRSQSAGRLPSSSMYTRNAASVPRLKKAASYVRLSMNGEGGAKVVTKDTSSPSPPHATQGPPPITSIMNDPLNTFAKVSAMRPLQRSASGRSRDSRVWEFWCDKEARSELEEKAEQDASGSAAGAIGLLRSASGRNILGAIPSKRNSTLARQSISMKRSKVELATPKLHKSSTALGRLENRALLNSDASSKPLSKLKHPQSPYPIHIPGNESDKENWSPATATSPDGQSDFGVDQTTHAEYYFVPRKRLAQTTDENHPRARSSYLGVNSGEDQEVAAFMRGPGTKKTMSANEELDCVQGLLSLSQGNWR